MKTIRGIPLNTLCPAKLSQEKSFPLTAVTDRRCCIPNRKAGGRNHCYKKNPAICPRNMSPDYEPYYLTILQTYTP